MLDPRCLAATCLSLVLLALPAPSSAEIARGFTPRGWVPTLTLPVPAQPDAVIGTFDAGSVEGATLQLALPDGRPVLAERRHLARTPAVGAVTWHGAFRDSPQDTVTLSVVRGVVTGTFTYRGQAYELRPMGSETVIYQVDHGRLPEPGPLRPVPMTGPARLADLVGTLAADQAPVLHDVLVMTTPAARARHGTALDGMVVNAVANANAAYRAGGIGITLNLVAIRAGSATEGFSSDATLEALSRDPEVAAARDEVGADVVVMIGTNSDNCGLAFFMATVSPGFAPFAFALVAGQCLGSRTFAHEIGHVQGLAHDRETAGPGATSSRPYAFGYRLCRMDQSGLRDIMSYACSVGSATQVNEFSSPLRVINGVTFGVSYETDPLNAADAVRALNDNAATVAAFRDSRVTVPLRPVSLAVMTQGFDHVQLGWVDGSTNETGFVVERTVAGGNWAEVARLAPESTSYRDVTVAPDNTYTYRIRAFNAAGYSEASNVVILSTESPLPTPLPFSFLPVTNAPRSTVVTSLGIVVTGFTRPAPISITGGEYSIGCTGTFTATAGTLLPDQQVCVRHTTAAAYATWTSTILTVGAGTGGFWSQTEPAPTPPPPPPPPPPPGGGSSGGSGGGGSFDWLAALLGLAAFARRRGPARLARSG